MNDAEGLSRNSTFLLIGSQRIRKRGAALTSRLQSVETKILTEEENFAGLMLVNRELNLRMNCEYIGKAEGVASPQRMVLDMDNTEILVYGQQEQSACSGHFESSCYHPLLLFNRDGDCLAAKPRPGNVQQRRGWDEQF